MFEVDFNFITGLSFGIEFPPLMEINEDILFAMAIDLGIFRFVVTKWKQAD